MDLHGSPNLREGLKIIPSDSCSKVIFSQFSGFRGLWLLPFSSSKGGFHSCHGSEAYGPFSLAPTEDFFSHSWQAVFWHYKFVSRQPNICKTGACDSKLLHHKTWHWTCDSQLLHHKTWHCNSKLLHHKTWHCDSKLLHHKTRHWDSKLLHHKTQHCYSHSKRHRA